MSMIPRTPGSTSALRAPAVSPPMRPQVQAPERSRSRPELGAEVGGPRHAAAEGVAPARVALPAGSRSVARAPGMSTPGRGEAGAREKDHGGIGRTGAGGGTRPAPTPPASAARGADEAVRTAGGPARGAAGGPAVDRAGAAALPKVVSDTIGRRAARPDVKQGMMGALVFLDDTQIRPRLGLNPSTVDARAGDGCIPVVRVNVPHLPLSFALPVPYPPIDNRPGEWASDVNPLPARLGNAKGESLVAIQDSNLFMTAAITYPMYLFDERALPAREKLVAPMRRQAMENVDAFQKDGAYNFWQALPGSSSAAPRTGPLNIPSWVTGLVGRSYLEPHLRFFWDATARGLNVPSRDWLQRVLDPKENPSGTDALFNIPDDADDTAMAVAIQRLHAGDHDPAASDPYRRDARNFRVDTKALEKLSEFRDVGRAMADPRDTWKKDDSGAFLTWLKDEKAPTFGDPASGVIPLGVNNVDGVVNANAVFSLALNGMKSQPGYAEACQLIHDIVDQGQWDKVGLYYPQKMMFPYTATRAFRDGGAGEPVMRAAMKKLVPQLLEAQRSVARQDPARAGAFPGGADRTFDLSTALGVVSLLNIGRDLAAEQGLGEAYDRAIERGIAYLTAHARPFTRFNGLLAPMDQGRKWDSGLFFSASYWDLAQWRSEAYTASIALEALAKYTLAYDLGAVDIRNGRRIRVDRYTRRADRAPDDFAFRVR